MLKGDLEKMKKFFYTIKSKLLTIFGDIKIFKFPFFLVYDPDDYQVTGDNVLKALHLLRPGDILIRGYNHYLDGKFIPSKEGWSHGAIYVGNNLVIHAVAEGVSLINVVDFMKCDRFAILRPRKNYTRAIKKAFRFLDDKIPYDFGFKKGVSALYCFELVVECYNTLDFRPKNVSILGGLIRRKNVYVADSFFESPDVKTIMEVNPRMGVYYVKEMKCQKLS